MVHPEDLVIVGTLIVLEGLLSADNALVLALLVRHLPKQEQHKALLYGLIGAFVLRGIGIALARIIITLWWLCGLGAGYLLWLCLKHFLHRGKEEGEAVAPTGPGFWRTVITVEFTDIIFAVDSILVAVALVNDPNKIWIVYTGGFLGIVMLRLAAGFFIRLVRKYPTLDNTAYALVGWAGAKLAGTTVELYGKNYGVAVPHLMPKPLFWGVFVLIVVVGVWTSLRNKPSEQDQAEQRNADLALDTWERKKDKNEDATP